MLKAFLAAERESESERRKERERERESERAWGIAGNYLVGKRCVNTGHTVFPRPFRAFLSRRVSLPLFPSTSLYPSIHLLHSLYTVQCMYVCIPCVRFASTTNFTARIPFTFSVCCIMPRDTRCARAIEEKRKDSIFLRQELHLHQGWWPRTYPFPIIDSSCL